VDISSVTAHSLEWHENPGHLSKQNIDESQIKPENRIPRVTSATWKYESGAVGTFTHVVALQGHDYSCELEVYADGYQFKYVPLPLRARPGHSTLMFVRQAYQPIRAASALYPAPGLGPRRDAPLPG
jgi:hypothetical protein